MATAVMSSVEFRSIVEPILNDAFDGIYTQRKDEWMKVFRTFQAIKRSYHEEPVLFGMPAAPAVPDGTPITYSSGGVLYNARYVPEVYGLAFALTQVLVEDGEHENLAKVYSEHLSQSLIETKETVAANVLNRAFNGSYIGGDGVSLVSNAHPVREGTQSNVLAQSAAMSQTSVEQMLIQIRRARDSAGRQIQLNAMKLVHAPENVFQAEVITKSAMRPGTANNDINAIKSMGMLSEEACDLTRLTSPHAWWIKTNAQRGLGMANRRDLTKSMEGDFQTDSMRYKAMERYSFHWTDWRGIYGTPGV